MQATTQGYPTITNDAELKVALVTRDELGDQLRSLSDMTSQLTQERMNASATNSTEQVAGLTERIKELVVRTRRVEQQKLAADDAIADAIRRGIAVSESEGEPTIIVPPPFSDFETPIVIDNEDRAAMIGGVVLGFVLIGMAMWRLGKRSAAKALGRTPRPPEQEGVKELRHAVEAIAVEVERISEGQRFVTALLSEKGQKDAAALAKGVNRDG
jgi:hypothetical protein